MSGPTTSVFDRTADGRPLRLLPIVDEYTRECLSIDVGRRLNSEHVLARLAELFVRRGVPEYIRSDNGPEFTAKAVRRWLPRVGVQTLFIEPGSPWENGYVESFNGKLRDEHLNVELFDTLLEAQVLTERWRCEYNQLRPHSSLGYRPPAPEATPQPLTPGTARARSGSNSNGSERRVRAPPGGGGKACGMRAEIVSIGTEILLGEIVDTNAAFIASQLPEYGIDLLYVSQVGDNPGRLEEVLARAWERSDLTFATGGLGPTEDDVTREAVAAVLGEELFVDDEQRAVLEARFGERGRTLIERNMKQAWLIPSARAIANPRGTAPGWWVERDGRVIALLPGPPAEMTHMWEHEVAPQLEERASAILVSHTLKSAGLGESLVDQLLAPLLSTTNPSIGLYARRDGVHVRISAKAPTRAEAWRLIHPLDEQVRALLGVHIWGEDEDTLAAGVGRLLRDRGLTLGLMESATGGAIASAITDVAGASDYFRGSLVTYATQTKVDYGVPAEVPATHGVISRETAEAMARAAREQLGADLGLGLTGIAGTDAIEGQPPGTMHIALTDGERVEHETWSYYQGREAAKRRATTQALNLVRTFLLGEREHTQQ